MAPTYTIHFQKYPYPGASHGIQALIARLRNTKGIIRLLGNPSGFEKDIQCIKDAHIQIQDETI
ncbi:MAG TPA: hypothetical protein VIY47_06350 [Ignavibacteriaceae bacterium]